MMNQIFIHKLQGISAGIPQVNRTKTEFVDHLKNGYIISKEGELEKALKHYLTTLKPWNEALVYSVDKIQEYTGPCLIAKWEGMDERIVWTNSQKTSHILQIGSENWLEQVEIPEEMGWHYFSGQDLPSLKEYMEEQKSKNSKPCY